MSRTQRHHSPNKMEVEDCHGKRKRKGFRDSLRAEDRNRKRRVSHGYIDDDIDYSGALTR